MMIYLIIGAFIALVGMTQVEDEDTYLSCLFPVVVLLWPLFAPWAVWKALEYASDSWVRFSECR